MRLISCCAFLCIAMLTTLLPVRAQDSHGAAAADTVARVPVLEQFHDVISVIWHEAWPAKNVAQLATLLPEVQSGVEKIATAALPGMLREKKGAWESGVADLRGAAKAYADAARMKDSTALLTAAETLHARYEALVRVIRPVMKEIDEFHATLYVLYHSSLPAYSLDAISRAAADLKIRMALLDEARLPERYKSRSDAFHAARKELGAAVASLSAAVLTRDEATVRAAVEAVHARYESLTHVFEK